MENSALNVQTPGLLKLVYIVNESRAMKANIQNIYHSKQSSVKLVRGMKYRQIKAVHYTRQFPSRLTT